MGILAYLAAVATFSIGLVVGVLIGYIVLQKPIWKAHLDLVDRLYRMKRQGFVPQFDFDQSSTHDPAAEIHEY